MFNRLYIHVPFCTAKCGYCAFYSVPVGDTGLIDRYLDKVIDELRTAGSRLNPLRSVYVGGGTPSVLDPDQLQRLLDAIRDNCDLVPHAEVSMESNPDSLTAEKIAVMASLVNRVSLGVQSLDMGLRSVIGRHGDAGVIDQVFGLVHGHGIGNVGADLIYGIPGQTCDEVCRDLQHVHSLGIKHLSAYSLTVEEGSRLVETELSRDLCDDASTESYLFIADWLAKQQMPQYEISNYAVPGYECKHNLDIWFGDTYLGLGPSASSFDGTDRWTEPADLGAWLNGEEAERDVIDRESREREIFAMGLRTVQGWDEDLCRKRAGGSWRRWQSVIDSLLEDDLLTISAGGRVIRPTDRGLLFWNTIAEALI